MFRRYLAQNFGAEVLSDTAIGIINRLNNAIAEMDDLEEHIGEDKTIELQDDVTAIIEKLRKYV